VTHGRFLANIADLLFWPRLIVWTEPEPAQP